MEHPGVLESLQVEAFSCLDSNLTDFDTRLAVEAKSSQTKGGNPNQGPGSSSAAFQGAVSSAPCLLNEITFVIPASGDVGNFDRPLSKFRIVQQPCDHQWEFKNKSYLASVPIRSFLKPRGSARDWTPEGPGAVALWTGSLRWAKSLMRKGCPWVLTFTQDLDCSATWEFVEGHVASFSRAITPPVRTPTMPAGVPHMPPGLLSRVVEGNRVNTWCSRLVKLCVSVGVRFWIANPACSWWWRQRCFRKLLKKDRCFSGSGCFHSFLFDCCRAGAPWRKRTKILTDFPCLPERILCSRNHKHLILRGSGPGGKAWTHFAELHPLGIAELLSDAAAEAARFIDLPTGWSAQGVLDESAKLSSVRCEFCFAQGARKVRRKKSFCSIDADRNHPFAHRLFVFICGCLLLIRISDCARPSLRQAVACRVGERTALREQRALHDFLSWLSAAGVETPLQDLAETCEVLDMLVRSFGFYLYDGDCPYYRYVYVVTALQNWDRRLKRSLPHAWDLAFVWRSLEPTVHRRPVCQSLLLAIVGVGVGWGWLRFGAVLLLMFYAGCRPVEPLEALRIHLVLPSDMMTSEPRAYLKIVNPKSGRRGGARQQHASVSHSDVVSILSRVFGGLDWQAPLWPGSVSSFRRRWDAACARLGLRKGFVTPGGVRGGAACFFFKQGSSIQDVMWRLRVLNHTTLSHYLQEVVADSTLSEVSAEARQRIALFSANCFRLWTCCVDSDSYAA